MTMPLVLQQEPSECGLACLAMVLKFYGSRVSLEFLRNKFDLSLRGTSIAGLVKIANSLKLDTTVYSLKANQLSSLDCPAILYWDSNHYVVFTHTDYKKGHHVLDPANGDCWLSQDEMTQHYSGYAIAIRKNKDHVRIKENYLITFKEIIQEIPKSVTSFLTIILLTLSLHLLIILFPRYIQQLIDPVLSKAGTTETVKLSIVILMVFKISEALLFLFRGLIVSKWEKIFTEHLGSKVFKHLIYLPVSFFEKRSQSSIYSRFHSIDKTREILGRGLAESFVDGLFSILTLGIIYNYNLQIGLIISLFTLGYLLFNFFIAKKAKSYNQIQIKEKMRETSFLIECLRGILPIKIFTREEQSINKWLYLHKKHLNTATKVHFLQTLLDASRILIFGTEIALIVMLSISLIAAHRLTLGMLYALIFYINFLAKSVSSITSKCFDLKLLSTHAETLSTLLVHQPEKNNEKPMIANQIESIHLNKVSFRYHKNEPWILKNIDLKVFKGECVMLCGPSGAGKSTLFKILIGVIVPTTGEIYVNGLSLENSNRLDYRQKIAAIMQEDELFSGTLYDNISFFTDEIDREKVHVCAKLAEISDEIEAMPMGYNSYIGDMGVAISGGQKQRILLARALYFGPSVLFLDEAFSHLDLEKENSLGRMLKKLGITQFIITHRRGPLSIADKVIDICEINGLEKNISQVS